VTENSVGNDSVLTICICTDNPEEYRVSESYRRITSVSLTYDIQVEWASSNPSISSVENIVNACNSRYIVFTEEGHTFSPLYFQVLTDYLSSKEVFLADSYRYADTIASTPKPDSLTLKYYYTRDTDIWGVAFHTGMLQEFLNSMPELDRQSVYLSYRLFYYLNRINPLLIGYSTHSDTKNVNGILLEDQTKQIAPHSVSCSQELHIYAIKMLINILRGMENGHACRLSVKALKHVAQSHAISSIAEVIPLSDRIEFEALRYLVNPHEYASYLHKRLGEYDAIIEFTEKAPGNDSVLLYHYQFSDLSLYVSKRYVKHLSMSAPDVIDHYRHLITSDSIILFFDRTLQADDNAEALYRYFIDKYPQYINAYFALNPKSSDWNRLTLAGFKLVPMFGPEFSDKFLHSDLVVSSQIYSPKSAGKDFSNSRFVYLQHGVIMNDMRQWIVSKCFDLFVTTGEPETRYLRSLAPRETINSGIPRLETLFRKPHQNKNFVYMPTWRFDLGRVSDGVFMESLYFQAIERLLLNSTLTGYLEQTNATLRVKLHPNLEKRAKLFPKSERVQISQDRYSQLISEADFIFTDYSSVVLDATYIDIPIAYYQFDRETFFDNQPYSERMDYEKEGLGPVFFHEDQLVDYITTESYAEQDAVYNDRREAFFSGVPIGHIRETIVERMLSL